MTFSEMKRSVINTLRWMALLCLGWCVITYYTGSVSLRSADYIVPLCAGLLLFIVSAVLSLVSCKPKDGDKNE